MTAGIASQQRGAYFTFILCFLAISGGLFLIHQGKSVAGLVSIIGSVTGLVSVFFYSKHEQKQERLEKSAALQARKR